MRGYFEQFGTVSKLRLSRAKKTGRSKHFAFLEFASPDIAATVAEAMDGYMMMGQKLQCRVLLGGEVHAELWKGANRKFKAIPWPKVEHKRFNKERTPQEAAKRLSRALTRDKKRAARIAAAGIDYSFVPLEDWVARAQREGDAGGTVGGDDKPPALPASVAAVGGGGEEQRVKGSAKRKPAGAVDGVAAGAAGAPKVKKQRAAAGAAAGAAAATADAPKVKKQRGVEERGTGRKADVAPRKSAGGASSGATGAASAPAEPAPAPVPAPVGKDPAARKAAKAAPAAGKPEKVATEPVLAGKAAGKGAKAAHKAGKVAAAALGKAVAVAAAAPTAGKRRKSMQGKVAAEGGVGKPVKKTKVAGKAK